MRHCITIGQLEGVSDLAPSTWSELQVCGANNGLEQAQRPPEMSCSHAFGFYKTVLGPGLLQPVGTVPIGEALNAISPPHERRGVKVVPSRMAKPQGPGILIK